MENFNNEQDKVSCNDTDLERCPTCAMPVKVVGKTTKHYEPDLSKLEVEVDETKLKSIIHEHVLIFETDGFYESDKTKHYEPDLSKLEVEVDETKLKSIIHEHVLIFETDGFYESDKEKMSKAIVNSKAFKIKFK